MHGERNGARPRHDTRARILAALTSEPSMHTQIEKSARILGLGHQQEAFRVLTRLEAGRQAIKETLRLVPRWRMLPAALVRLRPGTDPEA